MSVFHVCAIQVTVDISQDSTTHTIDNGLSLET